MQRFMEVAQPKLWARAAQKDVLGCVYEYFLSRFSSADGKKGGEQPNYTTSRPRAWGSPRQLQ